jgi:hypothetical protein
LTVLGEPSFLLVPGATTVVVLLGDDAVVARQLGRGDLLLLASDEGGLAMRRSILFLGKTSLFLLLFLAFVDNGANENGRADDDGGHVRCMLVGRRDRRI